MLDLHLTATPAGDNAVTAGYSCPCGCTPAATYRRSAGVATEGCCCGNQFAVGLDAASHIHPHQGYEVRMDSFLAPWGERVPVAWAIGPSTHSGSDHAHEDHGDGRPADRAVDPVCGMTVEPDAARAKGLHSRYHEADYFFCGKGCKLEFDDDPERYLDPSHVPSM